VTTPAQDDELTELVDADFSRVDLVGKGANGVPRFLITKQSDDTAGLFGPGFVRDLITKADPGNDSEETVTMTGSPAAIAKLIHDAAQSAPPKTDTSIESKETTVPDAETVTKDTGPELDDTADGMDPTIPLAAPGEDDAPGDPGDPGSPAWEAIDAATAQKWTSILSRARVAIDLLSEREMLEAASADPDDIDNAFDLQDVCCAIDYSISVLAPYAVAEQSEADTGADAMEAIGKAMAGFDGGSLQAIEWLAQVRKAGRVLSSANEASIRDAAASLQKVLTSLPSAPQTDDSGQPVAKKEADMAETATTDEQVEKSGAADTAPAPEAAADVTKTVAGLEAVVYDKDGAPGRCDPEKITKAADPQIALYDQQGVFVGLGGPQGIVKAAKSPQVAVYNATGKLVGIVDPAEITPIQGASTTSDGTDTGATDAAPDAVEPAAEPEAAAAPDAAAAEDMTPAPPATVGTPADGTQDDDVAKTARETGTGTTTNDVADVLKSIVAEAVAAALEGRAPAEDIAKQADVAGLSEKFEELVARIAKVEQEPAAPKVFTNGATPPAGTLRGQDRGQQGAPAVDVAKAAQLKGTLYHGSGPEQAQAANQMQEMAIAHLSALHAGNG
jgi:hypothetical protein